MPEEIASNSEGISADYQGVVDGLGTVAGAACNVAELSVDDNYDEWVISYNNARSFGLVGGAGFVVGGSNVLQN